MIDRHPSSMSHSNHITPRKLTHNEIKMLEIKKIIENVS
jgi:hypothetical protein